MTNPKIYYENLKLIHEPMFEELALAARRVIESGWYVLGKEVQDFEAVFAEFVGTKYAIGVASGLDAISIALKSLNLPEKSSVLVPSNTYIATILAVLQAGLRPVLVEPNMASYNVDAQGLESAIDTNTSAILLVHLYGKSCPMDSIKQLAESKNLPIIEDCAQAHGASYNGIGVGTSGLGAFSFYPTKNLGCLGDGGAISVNDDSLADQCQMIRNYGSRIKYENEIIGVNSRLDEMQAALLSVKIKYLKQYIEKKRTLAKKYFLRLENTSYILPEQSSKAFDTFHIFNIRTPHRDHLRNFLNESGISTEIHYPIPPHRLKALQSVIKRTDYPISEEIHATTLSLPISISHNEEDIEYVCEKLIEYDKKNARKI